MKDIVIKQNIDFIGGREKYIMAKLFGNKDKHDSYGMLQFSRSSGGSKSLFGSSIQHRDTITMYLREGEVSRELNRDFYFGGG